MSAGTHGGQGPAQGIHVIHNWDVADATARLALSVISADVGKVARQQSDASFWLLTGVGPATWIDITASGAAAPVFGTEFVKAEALGASTTTSTAWQTKATLNVPIALGGTYRVGVSYVWNHNSTTSDFEGRVQVDGATQGEIHKQEPKDAAGSDPSGTTQRYLASRVFYTTLLPGESPTITVDWRTDTGGQASTIYDAVIEFWRVS